MLGTEQDTTHLLVLTSVPHLSPALFPVTEANSHRLCDPGSTLAHSSLLGSAGGSTGALGEGEGREKLGGCSSVALPLRLPLSGGAWSSDASSSITSSPPSALGPSLCLTSGLPYGGLFGSSTPPRPRFLVSTKSSLS